MENNIIKKKIELEECTQILDIKKEINKILLLYNTHNLVCSYDETLEIFQLNSKEKKLNSLQEIIDPNFNTIELLYETKENANNKNYLLICSDMIHVFYLYDDDKKSILLQSINNFNYQYINKVYEKINGNIITLSNEYKISIFSNILINNDEIIDYNYIFNKGENFIENYREEIYELNIDKLNKKNEKIFSIIELFNNKLAYSFYINNEDEFDDCQYEDEEENINNNDECFIFVKFLDEKYNEIKELLICKYDYLSHKMFQLSEMVMCLINTDYIYIINLKYYEVIIKIKADEIYFSQYFDNNKNNFFNYLFLYREEELSDNDEIMNENSEEQDNNDKDKKVIDYFNVYDLKTIINNGIPKKLVIEYKEFYNIMLNISKILTMCIIEEKNNNIYHCAMYNISKNDKINEGLNLIFLKFEIHE